MLTGELVRPRLRIRGASLSVEWLPTNDLYRRTAGELITLFRKHLGEPLRVWAEALDGFEGTRTDYFVIRGLAKVLADSATFTPVETPIAPVQLREQLFRRGPVFTTTDLFHQQTREELFTVVAGQLGIGPEQVE